MRGKKKTDLRLAEKRVVLLLTAKKSGERKEWETETCRACTVACRGGRYTAPRRKPASLLYALKLPLREAASSSHAPGEGRQRFLTLRSGYWIFFISFYFFIFFLFPLGRRV